jgi:hypothetical protein
MTYRLSWALGLLLMASAGSLVAQSEGQEQPAQPAAEAAGTSGQTATPGEQGTEQTGAQTGRMMDQIDEILEGEEEALAGGGYSYDPGDRRDPFESLLNSRLATKERGPRPEGVPGLLIDEVGVSGIFVTPEGAVAQVQAANKEKSYLLRVGDQLYDGEVISISNDEVVFRQIVRDPTALKPFREVVKKLNP